MRPTATILHWTSGCERLYGWSKRGGDGTGRATTFFATTHPQPRDEIIAELREARQLAGRTRGTAGKDGAAVSIASLWVAQRSEDEHGSSRCCRRTTTSQG